MSKLVLYSLETAEEDEPTLLVWIVVLMLLYKELHCKYITKNVETMR